MVTLYTAVQMLVCAPPSASKEDKAGIVGHSHWKTKMFQRRSAHLGEEEQWVLYAQACNEVVAWKSSDVTEGHQAAQAVHDKPGASLCLCAGVTLRVSGCTGPGQHS